MSTAHQSTYIRPAEPVAESNSVNTVVVPAPVAAVTNDVGTTVSATSPAQAPTETKTDNTSLLNGNRMPRTLEELALEVARLGGRIVMPKKAGRPRKYATEEQSKAARQQKAAAWNRADDYKQVREHMKNNGYQAQLEYHRRTGYAAQRRYRERMRAERIAAQRALTQQAGAQAHSDNE